MSESAKGPLFIYIPLPLCWISFGTNSDIGLRLLLEWVYCGYCYVFLYSKLTKGIGGLKFHKTCWTPPHVWDGPTSGTSGLCQSRVLFFYLSSIIQSCYMFSVMSYLWTSTHIFLEASWGSPLGNGFSALTTNIWPSAVLFSGWHVFEIFPISFLNFRNNDNREDVNFF